MRTTSHAFLGMAATVISFALTGLQPLLGDEAGLLEQLDQRLNPANLKSAILRYSVSSEYPLESNVAPALAEVTAVFDGDNYLVRTDQSYSIDATDPAAPRRVDRPLTSFEWSDPCKVVVGYSDREFAWRIFDFAPGRTPDKLAFLDDLSDFAQLGKADYAKRMVVIDCKTNESREIKATLECPALGSFTELNFSPSDGDGKMPVREVTTDKATGAIKRMCQWLDWQLYGGVYLPRLAILELEVTETGRTGVGDETATRTRWVKRTYTLLNAESVNEPIHKLWFIPKLPDDMVGVSDESSERVRFADRTEIPYRLGDVDERAK